jgi:hypothetical protein
MVRRIACTMIVVALVVVCCLVALLLCGALSPDRVWPMLTFYATCGSGLSLVLGLVILERHGVRYGDGDLEGR